MKTSSALRKGNYFVLRNELFSLGLSANAIAVYTYLVRLEDRKTNVCWAKQKSIGDAVGIKSPKTVAKALAALEDADLIYREAMTMTHNGKRVNGVQRFTIRPIEDAIQHRRQEQMERLNRMAAAQEVGERIARLNEKHADNPLVAELTDSTS